MGTRLYPNTKNARSLEILANVPEGTHARLEAFEKKHGLNECTTFAERQAKEEAYYDELFADEQLDTLNAFLVFGWGKFSHVPGLSSDYSGSLNSVPQAAMLLQSNGIYLDDYSITEGVHWC